MILDFFFFGFLFFFTDLSLLSFLIFCVIFSLLKVFSLKKLKIRIIQRWTKKMVESRVKILNEIKAGIFTFDTNLTQDKNKLRFDGEIGNFAKKQMSLGLDTKRIYAYYQ